MKREKLVVARYRKGWTQEQASERLGVTRNTISQWELGKTSPYPLHIARLCEIYASTAEGLGLVSEANQKPLALNDPLVRHYAQTDTQLLPSLDHQEEMQAVILLEDQPDLFSFAIHALVLHQQQCQWNKHELEQRVTSALEQKTISSRQPPSISRREMLQLITSLPIVLSGLANVSRPSSASLDPKEVISLYAAGISACWSMSKGNSDELALAKTVLSSYLPGITTIAQQLSHHQTHASGQAAQCYQLRSLLNYHLTSLAVAEEDANHAVAYGRFADDPEVFVSALVHSAVVSFYRHQPEVALRKCQEAHLLQKQITPAMSSFLYRVQAACEACMQQKDEAMASLHNSYYHIARCSTYRSSSVYVADEPFELALWDGITRYHLGMHESAQQTLQEIDPLNSRTVLPERVRTGFLNTLLLNELHMSPAKRDMEQCIMIWKESMTRAKNLKSELRLQESYRAYESMSIAFPEERRIVELKQMML